MPTRRLLAVLLLVFCMIPPATARARIPPPRVLSRAAVVLDLDAHRTLYAKQADRRRPIASLTKLMTAMIVLDSKRSPLKPLRVTSADVDRLKWSRSRLPVGSLLLRRTLLHIALMSSENRAAFALSRSYPGGRPGFVRAMNRKARLLGMRGTHFVDPTGLSPANVSTARDLARLAGAALRYPTIRRDTTSLHKLVLGGGGPLMYYNSNHLVRGKTWPIVLQKTGFTNEAGHCLIVVTRVRGHAVLIALLDAPNAQAHFDDAMRLRRWVVRTGLRPATAVAPRSHRSHPSHLAPHSRPRRHARHPAHAHHPRHPHSALHSRAHRPVKKAPAKSRHAGSRTHSRALRHKHPPHSRR